MKPALGIAFGVSVAAARSVRIIEGNDVLETENAPYMVSLQYSGGGKFCGGSILSDKDRFKEFFFGIFGRFFDEKFFKFTSLF
jgi:hypothetical protein